MKYDVISHFRHSYGKGPFCMTWLISQFICILETWTTNYTFSLVKWFPFAWHIICSYQTPSIPLIDSVTFLLDCGGVRPSLRDEFVCQSINLLNPSVVHSNTLQIILEYLVRFPYSSWQNILNLHATLINDQDFLLHFFMAILTSKNNYNVLLPDLVLTALKTENYHSIFACKMMLC